MLKQVHVVGPCSHTIAARILADLEKYKGDPIVEGMVERITARLENN